MPDPIVIGLSLPHHSTAAINLPRDLAAYNDEAWCIDLAITEQGNNSSLISFQPVTTAIVLATLHEDFDTLRADVAAIYHAENAKIGSGNGTGQNERLRPDQLPILIIQHGRLGNREELNSESLRDVLNYAMVWAKHSGDHNAILAVMPRTTL